MLGAGVYALTGVIAGEVGGAVWVALLVALGFALLTAGSYAELVTKYPHAGESAVFAARAYKSPLVSFLVGFCMLAAAVTSAAGLSLAFAGGYLSALMDIPTHIAALAFLVVIGLFNARGIKESLSANLVMTAIELSGLLLVIVAAAWFLRGGEVDFSRVVEFKAGVNPAYAVLVLRRDKVAADHFRVTTWVPVLGIASCLLLMSLQGAQTWLRAGALLIVGVALYGITRAGRVQPLKAEDYKVMDS